MNGGPPSGRSLRERSLECQHRRGAHAKRCRDGHARAWSHKMPHMRIAHIVLGLVIGVGSTARSQDPTANLSAASDPAIGRHAPPPAAALSIPRAAFLLAASDPAASQSASASDLDAKIDSAVREVLKNTGVPSASVGVVQNGRVVITRAYGQARLSPARPATVDMLYAVGSISKQFTAACILLLQEDEKLEHRRSGGHLLSRP